MITLADLPAEAHLTFECPFCRIKNAHTALSTSMAERLEWKGNRAQFTGITCPACGKSLTFEATYKGPPAG